MSLKKLLWSPHLYIITLWTGICIAVSVHRASSANRDSLQQLCSDTLLTAVDTPESSGGETLRADAGADTVHTSEDSAGGSSEEREKESVAQAGQRADINGASAHMLQEVHGIGPVIANRICDYRRRAGTVESMEELRAVDGVGPKTLEKLRASFSVQ
ncbi:MAG: ComEA family DNA-binding protein [Fibrobacterota bacterium]